ncbi:protoporphyrinogen/coproporphyrinogen oxidase [Thiococcus pfennigii]|uniref:protoporphyrinogen/coproporphyrinogen oxidase n=1 Tax=Thiococcus pfennigii TaxID=1057 RepID=UPI001906CFA4|nr:FAD-dependent oxidoreductase [Thiococcus pfennigii]MBK1700704.1 amine oxidase [Thiococcus pfennigii]MBK1730348.1 amine oxidase [Thiococcus pfennigii]
MDYDHIVIGAGISGLGAAHFAARAGHPSLVLERSERIGGCIHSHRFARCGDFWTEAGSHTGFNSYGTLLSVLEDLDQMARLTAKDEAPYRLWRNGRLAKVTSALHPLEAAVSLPRLFTTRKTGASVAEYYGRGIGRRNYRDLLGPAFQALICQPADDYPAELLFRRKPRRKDVLRKFTMPTGLSEIPTALAGQADIEVRTGQEVVAIVRDGPGYRVQLADGDELGCHYLTLAAPPNVVTRLLPDDLAAAKAAVGTVGMAEIETLLLAFRTSDLDLPRLAGLISVDDAFYSAVSRDYLADPEYRGFAFHFRPGALAPEARIATACRALGADPAKVVEVAQVANRLPALRKGHQAIVEQLDAELAGGRLAVTGNWFYGVSLEDSLSRSRQEHGRVFGEA